MIKILFIHFFKEISIFNWGPKKNTKLKPLQAWFHRFMITILLYLPITSYCTSISFLQLVALLLENDELLATSAKQRQT